MKSFALKHIFYAQDDSLVILQSYLVMHIIRQVFILHKKVDTEYGAIVAGYIGVFPNVSPEKEDN